MIKLVHIIIHGIKIPHPQSPTEKWVDFLNCVCVWYSYMHVKTLKWFNFHVLCLFIVFLQVNISLVVNDSEAEQCVRALHSVFFESELSELES